MRLFDIFKKRPNIPDPRPGHQTIIVEKEINVQIGQPANYPTDIVQTLQTLFARSSEVRKAYLGWIFDPASGEAAHLMIALDIIGESSAIIEQAGPEAQKFLKPGELIDFIRIDDAGGISDYFTKETIPFFEQNNDLKE